MKNKIALITGASYGIGWELAKIFARDQYDLIIVARSISQLQELKQELSKSLGVVVHAVSCDLSRPGASRYLYEEIKKIGLTVDVLVNNAGIGDWGLFVDSKLDKQESMMQLNMMALTDLSWLFLPGMLKRGQGRILNVASTAAFQPGPLMAVYFATKAYVLSFSLAIAQEIKGSGVTVTCLCPGPTATKFQASNFPKELRLSYGVRLADPKELAEYGYKAMLKGKIVAVHGLLNKVMVFALRFLPRGLVLQLVHYMQESK